MPVIRPKGPIEAVLFDLDSTLADTLHRQWMVEDIKRNHNRGPTWDDYSMACANDKPIEGTIALARMLAGKYEVFIVTGRSSAAKALTEEWLFLHGVPYYRLIMRPAGDRTPNGQYKVGVIRDLIEHDFRPVLFVEDYPAVAKEITDETGVPVLLVNANYPDDAPHANPSTAGV